jgi:hypothetical protein
MGLLLLHRQYSHLVNQMLPRKVRVCLSAHCCMGAGTPMCLCTCARGSTAMFCPGWACTAAVGLVPLRLGLYRCGWACTAAVGF